MTPDEHAAEAERLLDKARYDIDRNSILTEAQVHATLSLCQVPKPAAESQREYACYCATDGDGYRSGWKRHTRSACWK